MKLVYVACLVFVFAFVGCQKNDGVATLTGTLLIDGKPAPDGVALSFDPSVRGKRGSAGFTDADGNFEAIYSMSRKGVQVGECIARLANGVDMEPPKPGKSLNRAYPDKYYLEIKTFIVEPGRNKIELEITSKK